MSKLIFSNSNLTYWIFGLCFATSIGLIFFLLEHMRLQLNCVLVPEKGAGLSTTCTFSRRICLKNKGITSGCWTSIGIFIRLALCLE